MKKLMFVAFCLTSLWGFSQGCAFTLTGKVLDFHNGTAIVDANILVKGSKKYAVSDSEGKFEIKGLCKGKVTLIISHISCKTIEKTINLTGNLTSSFRLEHHAEELEEITIKGKTMTKKTATLSETILFQDIVDSYSSASLGDALREVPGVSSISTGNAIVKPMINGMHSSRIIVMNNGVRLQDQEWGIEHAPNVDINAAGSISVIKGAGALAYGSDAIGGVVLMNPSNNIRKDSLFGKTITGFQSNGRGYHIATSLSKTFESGYYINANASYKRFGDYRAPDYFLTNTGSNSFAYAMDAGYRTFKKGWSVFVSHVSNEIGILSSAHIGGIRDLVNAINSQQPIIQDPFGYSIDFPKQEVEHWIAKASYFQRFENLGKLTLQYDFQENQRFEFDRRVGDDRFKPAVDLNLTTHSATSDFLFDASDVWEVQSGLLFRYQENIANPDTGIRRLIPDYQRLDLGVYTTANYKVTDELELEFGVRYDLNYYDVKKFYQTSRWQALGYDVLFADLVIRDLGTQVLVNPELDFHNVAISLGTHWNINDESSLLFNYSLSNRPPNISELFSDGLHHSAARIELGDLTLDSEQSHRISVAYQGETDHSSWQLDGSLNVIQDYIYLAPNGTEQTIRGAFPVWSYFQTNAFLVGLDARYKRQLSNKWSYEFSTSYLYAQDTDANQAIIDIPPFQMRNTIRYKNKEWNNFSSALVSDFVGRQNRFPDFNFVQFIAVTNSNELVDISSPPNAYHLLHFQNSIELPWFEKTKVQLSFNINNLLNTSYRDYLNRLRFFADDLGRNFQIQLKLNY